MAQRRMFSLKVIDTDSFLDMSQTAQLLYFHLSLRADDDGFVANPKKVMRMANITDDDMKILIAKKYIIPFESGVCVIRDWKIHNYIQSDRYQETHYIEEKSRLKEDEKGVYLLEDTKCIQNVSKMDTQVRLGKDRLELGKVIYGEFRNVFLSENEILSLKEKVKDYEILVEDLSRYIASTGKKYKSHYATLLSWQRRRTNGEKNKSISLIE